MIVEIVTVFVLLILWAFFAGSETAFVSCNKFKLLNLKKRGEKSAYVACFFLEKPGRLLSTTLVGTNISMILASNLVARIYHRLFGVPKPVMAILTVTLISLIFCEVLPKNLALRKSLQWTQLSSFIVFLFYIIFFPIGRIFSFFAKMIIRIVGIHHTGLITALFTKKDDVKFFLTTQLQAHFPEDQSSYILDSLDFSKKRLSEIMVPLVEINALPNSARVRDCYDFVRKYDEFYIPVYNTRIDNIVGIITVKDILNVDKNLQISAIIREPLFVPESRSIGELYRELYDKDLRVIFAVDEHGGVTGMANLYDIGEVIVGRIGDREEDIPLVRIREGEYLCKGSVEIDELNDLLSIKIEQKDFTTLNGLMLNELGRIPVKGDTITLQGYRFIVERGSKRRAELIRIIRIV
ncbi:MAG: hemolysin family protein [Spirochaetota bacterium]